MSAPARISSTASDRELTYRHSAIVRLTHWINVICLAVLLMSGLQIFNAHPSLYFGDKSTFDRPALDLKAVTNDDGTLSGVTSIFGREFRTTGVLGASREAPDGKMTERGFPAWATLPSYRALAIGRRWHFFFAWLFVINGLVYLTYAVVSRHAWRDLVPSRTQLRHIGHSIKEHALLRFPKGNEARSYNVLQRLAYLTVIFVVLPVTILAGLMMSPALNTAFPWLLELFGGRQTARTIHFIGAWTIVLFVLVHVLMVILSGFWNNMRSMITGWFAVERTHD